MGRGLAKVGIGGHGLRCEEMPEFYDVCCGWSRTGIMARHRVFYSTFLHIKSYYTQSFSI